MKRMATFIVATGLLAAAGAVAAPTSTCSGHETRDIKALSSDEVAALLAGKGMGYAKAAELNGYPGPAHVLEHAAQRYMQLRGYDASHEQAAPAGHHKH